MCLGDLAHNLINSCGEPLGYIWESTWTASGRVELCQRERQSIAASCRLKSREKLGSALAVRRTKVFSSTCESRQLATEAGGAPPAHLKSPPADRGPSLRPGALLTSGYQPQLFRLIMS